MFIKGTSGNDTIDGTDSDDQIAAFGGDDKIYAGLGSDTITIGNGGTGSGDFIDGDGHAPGQSDSSNGHLTGLSPNVPQAADTDTVVLDNSVSNYTLSFNNGQFIATAGAVTETMVNVEQVVFNDQTILVVGAGSAYATIQDAVDAAQDGDTILVAGGTYTEQLDIDGKSNLTIRAADGADVIIKAPSEGLTATANSSTGRDVNAVVTVQDSTNVVLQGITVDGDGQGANVTEGSGSGLANFVGVLYLHSSGELDKVDITGVRDATVTGAQRGYGVQVDNGGGDALTFAMHGGSIEDFQKDAGYFTNVVLDISNVKVVGAGATGALAQNGFVLFDSSGHVDNNDVSGIGYTGGDTSGDVLVYSGNHDLTVNGNTFTGVNSENTDALVVGVYVDNASSNVDVSGNTISDVDAGVQVYGQPDGDTVHDNTITNLDQTQSGAYGIDFDPDSNLTGSFTVSGSDTLDHLAGSAGTDSLLGLGGADSLEGRDGADTLDGGAGADTILGGIGADSIIGGLDADSMVGGGGNDFYSVDNAGDVVVEDAGNGEDTVSTTLGSYTLGANVEDLTYGGAGNFRGFGNGVDNILTGGVGSDNLVGGGGNDTLLGGDGSDTLNGNAGTDSLVGGAGGDTYVLSNRGDTVTEAANGGFDTLQVSGFGVDLHNYANIEGVKLTGTGDYGLTGDDANNRLSGNDGANRIVGGIGADTLVGGAGADTFVYNSLADSTRGAGRDVIQDFHQGEDLINLFAIDARVDSAGNNAFSFIGTDAFTGEGQLRATYDSASNTTTIEANVDHDLRADLKIVLLGDVAINDGDFVL